MLTSTRTSSASTPSPARSAKMAKITTVPMTSRLRGSARGGDAGFGDGHDAVGDRTAELPFRLVDAEVVGGDLEDARDAVDLCAFVDVGACRVDSQARADAELRHGQPWMR